MFDGLPKSNPDYQLQNDQKVHIPKPTFWASLSEVHPSYKKLYQAFLNVNFFFSAFLGPQVHTWHVECLRRGVELEL